MQSEHLLRKTQADNILERTAMQLQPLLHEACEALRPFPPFPNALFTHAIEIEAPAEATMDYGCIVVCEDGEFYELQMGIDHDAVEMSGSWDPVTARKETLEKIDLHPRDYVAFAYNAIGVVTELLLEREQEEQGAKGTGGA